MLARLPLSDPGEPDLRSPVRFLFWIARKQRSTVAAGGIFGAVWMGAQGLIPAAIGAAIDAVVDRHKSGLIAWSMVVLGLGVLQAIAGVLRHRRAVTNFLKVSQWRMPCGCLNMKPVDRRFATGWERVSEDACAGRRFARPCQSLPAYLSAWLRVYGGYGRDFARALGLA